MATRAVDGGVGKIHNNNAVSTGAFAKGDRICRIYLKDRQHRDKAYIVLCVYAFQKQEEQKYGHQGVHGVAGHDAFLW